MQKKLDAEEEHLVKKAVVASEEELGEKQETAADVPASESENNNIVRDHTTSDEACHLPEQYAQLKIEEDEDHNLGQGQEETSIPVGNSQVDHREERLVHGREDQADAVAQSKQRTGSPARAQEQENTKVSNASKTREVANKKVKKWNGPPPRRYDPEK